MNEVYRALDAAAVFYRHTLQTEAGRGARAELDRRGLGAPECAPTLEAFAVGYAAAEWDALAQHFKRLGVSPAAAEQAGLLVPRQSGSGHYDRFRNRLMFAVHDEEGRVVAFSGRVLPDPKTGVVDLDVAKYMNSPETAVYRKGETVFGLFQAKSALAGGAVVVEGNFDVVSLHARGLTQVVAPLGTAFTPDQARKLRAYTSRVTLLFDGDAAGRLATARAIDPSRIAGLDAYVAPPVVGKDPDDLVREGGREAIERVLRRAKPLLEHLVAETISEHLGAHLDDPIGMAREITVATHAVDVLIGDHPRRAALEALAHRLILQHAPFARRIGFFRQRPRYGQDVILDAVFSILRTFPELLPEVPERLRLVPDGSPSGHRDVASARAELAYNLAKIMRPRPTGARSGG